MMSVTVRTIDIIFGWRIDLNNRTSNAFDKASPDGVDKIPDFELKTQPSTILFSLDTFVMNPMIESLFG